MAASAFPVCPLRLHKRGEESMRRGMPWLYASDIIASSELMMIPPGSLVSIEDPKGRFLGIGYYNGSSRIACRVLAAQRLPIDQDFFQTRLRQALLRRDERIGVPYYRLVHSEADGLPGLLADRFGERLVIQVGTAGMEALQPLWLAAVEALLRPRAILLRNDHPARALEGLTQGVSLLKGDLPELVELREYDCRFLADLRHGQKTGWFYDQRDNRRMMAERCEGKTVLDMYAHSGGFGVPAALAGAAQVVMADSSRLALDLAQQAAQLNNVQARCVTMQGDAFLLMEQLAREGRRFDIVLADPPAFVKSRKDIASGLKGYEKVARLAATLVAPQGLLFTASCSHHAGRSAFNKAVMGGVAKAHRRGDILAQTGAASDHPLHPQLPQSEYLKGLLLRLA